jgi:alpha-L-fucosidase
MRSHRLVTSLFATLAIACCLVQAGTAIRAQAPAPDAAKAARLRWFRDARFGLFIHWGLYAIPAGQWKGRTIPGIGEWIMNRARIPVAEYEKLAAQFNPVKFDADAWAQLAEDAGMKYIVITSKHHDGFALFQSKASPYNVVDATPFRRDILKELAEACRRRGMRLGFYYSQSQDWRGADAVRRGTGRVRRERREGSARPEAVPAAR